MSAPTSARRNGRKLGTATCHHAPTCEVAQLQGDLKAQIQDVRDALSLMLQDAEAKGKHLKALTEQVSNVLARLSDVAERQTVASQREERWLTELGEVTRNTAQLSVRAVREELGPIVKAEVKAEVQRAMAAAETERLAKETEVRASREEI